MQWVIDKEEKKCYIVDFAIPMDHHVKEKEDKKMEDSMVGVLILENLDCIPERVVCYHTSVQIWLALGHFFETWKSSLT